MRRVTAPGTIITLDGPAASGKSSVARRVAMRSANRPQPTRPTTLASWEASWPLMGANVPIRP